MPGQPVTSPRVAIPVGRYDAVVFDMDGVVTDTATVHEAAWARLFDEFLAARDGPGFRRFSTDDYLRHVDGKPRYDGVASFLSSRGIELARGSPGDPGGADTICGLGDRKDAMFRRAVAERGVRAYPGTVALVAALRAARVRVACISASRNARLVLTAAGVLDRFDTIVDGCDADRLALRGKPDPAIFLAATARLGATPSRTVVVEDALAGVAAGRRGRFGLVLGVDRTGHAAELLAAGADVVVPDLSYVDVVGARPVAAGEREESR